MHVFGLIRRSVLLYALLFPLVLFGETFDEMIATASAAWEKVEAYTCLMHKKENIRGEIVVQNNIFYKFKKQKNYYLKWSEGSYKGMELIYREGAYGNKSVVRLQDGLGFITVKINPEGYLALRNNRHSVWESDIGKTIERIKTNYEKAKRAKEGVFSIEKETLLEGRKTILVKAEFPANKGYYGAVIWLYYDTALSLPVKVIVNDWEGKLLEEYHFAKLNTSAKLSDTDFDINNKSYDF